MTLFQALLAQALLEADAPEEALDVLRLAQERIDETGEVFFAAEIARLEAEALRRLDREEGSDIEVALRRALDFARAQAAKSLELRAARDLARLWLGQRKLSEARALLAPIYGWFAEGFDTPDLKEARALLVDLNGE